MDEFRSRTQIAPVDRAVVRAAAPVPAVKAITVVRATDAPDARPRPASPDAAAPLREGDLASVAEFVEVHARVAAILADLGSGAMSVDDATEQVIPRPFVFVPLPPASREAVEHAETVAKRIVERASYAHSAHAPLSRAMVEQIGTL